MATPPVAHTTARTRPHAQETHRCLSRPKAQLLAEPAHPSAALTRVTHPRVLHRRTHSQPGLCPSPGASGTGRQRRGEEVSPWAGVRCGRGEGKGAGGGPGWEGEAAEVQSESTEPRRKGRAGPSPGAALTLRGARALPGAPMLPRTALPAPRGWGNNCVTSRPLGGQVLSAGSHPGRKPQGPPPSEGKIPRREGPPLQAATPSPACRGSGGAGGTGPPGSACPSAPAPCCLQGKSGTGRAGLGEKGGP